MIPVRLPSTAEFRKRECQSYLGVNLKFMTSARSTVAESVTQQVCQGGGPWGGTWAAGRAVGVPARSAEQRSGPRSGRQRAEQGCREAGPGLTPLFPSWAPVCSSVSGSGVPRLPGQRASRLRARRLVSCARLCSSKGQSLMHQESPPRDPDSPTFLDCAPEPGPQGL